MLTPRDAPLRNEKGLRVGSISLSGDESESWWEDSMALLGYASSRPLVCPNRAEKGCSKSRPAKAAWRLIQCL